jgi:hypothetical protein
LLVWIGANDQAMPISTFTKDLEFYWQERRAVGFNIIAFTVLPRGDKTAYENTRVAINDWIRTNQANYCDGLADVAGARTARPNQLYIF